MEKRVNIGKIVLITGIVLGLILIFSAIYLLLTKEDFLLQDVITDVFKEKTFFDYSMQLFNLTFTAKYKVNSSALNFDSLIISQNTFENVRVDVEINGVKGYFLKLKDESYFCNEKCKKIEKINYLIPQELFNETFKKVSSRNGKDCFSLQNNTICFTKEGIIDYAFVKNKEFILTNVTYSVSKKIFELK